jgi:hypothetical protein
MEKIVNYVWMDQKKDRPQAIPTYLFARLQQNASLYADAKIQLWTEGCRKNYEDYAIPSNLTVCNLNSIPSFTDDPLLAPILSSDKEEYIWTKVDVARLLVLRHVLTQNEGAIVVYSDFDVPDIAINSKRFEKCLSKNGAVFAATFDPESNEIWNCSENGYMAFVSRRLNLLDYIITVVSEEINQNNRDVKLGRKCDELGWRDFVYYAVQHSLISPRLPESWFMENSLPVLAHTEWSKNVTLLATPAGKEIPMIQPAPIHPTLRKKAASSLFQPIISLQQAAWEIYRKKSNKPRSQLDMIQL